jgi:O-antigen ligase
VIRTRAGGLFLGASYIVVPVSAGIVLLAGAIAAYTTEHALTGLTISAALLVASILAVRTRDMANRLRLGWIPIAWIALLLVADYRFGDPSRTPLAAAYGNPSLENILQVAVFAVVGAMIVRSRHVLVQQTPSKIPKLPILLFPCFALASSLWSPIPLFTLVRALQLLVFVAFALLMVRIWQHAPEMGKSLWRGTFAAFVQVVTIVTIVGFIVNSREDNRFTWPGVHPGVTATYTGIAILILVVGGRSLAPPPTWAYWLRLFVLGAATYLGRTRTALGALAFAGLILLWDCGRERPIVRYLGIWYYGLGGFLLVLMARSQVVDYLSRGQSSQGVASISGRIPLWDIAVRDLSEAGKWIAGFGYGAARIVLYPQVSWAGTAHNTWIEALIGLGIIGTVFLAADVVFLLWRLGWNSRPNPSVRLALVLFAFLLVISGTSDQVAAPTIGFAMLALIHVPALGQWGRLRGVRATEPAGIETVRSQDRQATHRASPDT